MSPPIANDLATGLDGDLANDLSGENADDPILTQQIEVVANGVLMCANGVQMIAGTA